MNTELTTLEVRQNGGKARLFRFEESEITIGFTPRCLLSLEPQSENGAELVLTSHAGKGCSVRALRNPGSFSLNGTPCSAEEQVKNGDVLTVDSYQITLRSLPKGPSGSNAAGAESKSVEATTPAGKSTVAEPANTGVAPAPGGNQTGSGSAGQKGSLSYLQIFFAPVEEFLLD